MATEPRHQIETLRDRITDSTDIAEADEDWLLTFSDRLDLLKQTYSDHRHVKLLRHCTIIAETLDDGTLTAALEEREAAEAIVRWINTTYENEETNRDYRVALRVFAKRVAGGADDDCPPSVEWVPTGTSSEYDPSPDPRNMLEWDEHIKPMIEAAYNARDAALVALQFDAGLRGSELESLTVGDIQDNKYGLQITVKGKQDRRTLTIVPAIPYVNRWLDAHPARDDLDAPLWSKLHQPKSISYHMIGKTLKQLADRAGVEKPITVTNLRKSSAAFLASRNMSQAIIEDRHGWVCGSDAASRYVSVFSEASDRELARVHGIDVSDDEPAQITPLTCPRCEKETPREEPLCVWCGQAMRHDAVTELEKSDDDLSESLASLPREKAEQLLDVADALDDPEIKNALLEAR